MIRKFYIYFTTATSKNQRKNVNIKKNAVKTAFLD